MSGPVNSSTAAPSSMDYTLAAYAAIASQDAPPAPARPMQGDRSQVQQPGTASASVPLNDQDVVYQDQNGRTYTQAQLDQAQHEADTERRVRNGISGGTSIAMGAATAVSAVRALNTARTAATAVSTAARAGSAVSTAAKAGSLLSRVGSKVLPGLGIAFGVVSIGGTIANWNSEGNNKHWDDGLRMAGDALTIAGSAVTLSGVGAPIGLGLAAAGLVVSGIGMLFDDQ